jgi:hypothetical protein
MYGHAGNHDTQCPIEYWPLFTGDRNQRHNIRLRSGPIDPETEEIVERDPAVQTRQTLANVAAILDAADHSLDDVVK